MSLLPNRRRALGMLAAGGLAGATGRARSQAPGADGWPVRTLFLNTHLLPAIAQQVAGKRGQDDYRTAAIAAQLDRYDLVGLCEVFEARRRREIVRIAQLNSGNAFHWVESPKASGRHLICGGLLLLSRYPIEGEPHAVTYRDASRVLTNGIRADGLAAKGALHARLRLSEQGGLSFDCFLTHLESISRTARQSQIAELAAFIAEHGSPERPMLLMGDLNVEADFPRDAAPAETQYRQMTSLLRLGDEPLVDLWAALYATRGGTNDPLANEQCRRIDYLFLSPPRYEAFARWETAGLRVEPFFDPKVKQGSLSDHAGLDGELVLRPNYR